MGKDWIQLAHDREGRDNTGDLLPGQQLSAVQQGLCCMMLRVTNSWSTD